MVSIKLFRRVANPLTLAIVICLLFFIAYAILAIVRHQNYQSYGYDLGINDQTVWRYSRLELPITTIDPLPGKPKLAQHVELIYALISPAYWVWPARKMLILVSTFALCSGGIAAYLLAKKRLKNEFISFSILISYLLFFGTQHAAWFDVHSTNFAAPFIMWFIYFVDQKKHRLSMLFFLLAITTKENVATYTIVISLLYLIRRKDKILWFFIAFSIFYLLFLFTIFFPHIMNVTYQYQNSSGFFSSINPLLLFNTKEKLLTILYSYGTFGLLPLLNPLTIPLIFLHFTTFFVLASDLPGAQGIYGHYRVTLAPLFAWSTVITIGTFSFLNKKLVGIYIICCALFMQYTLHLPLSYLTKAWFWERPQAADNINALISDFLPENASVVSQNNITPHISQREYIYTLYPTKREFAHNSPCNEKICDWFTWHANPKYLIVDSSAIWDARHLLTDNLHFNNGISNLEKAGAIQLYRERGKARLYEIKKSPNNY